MYCTVPIPPEAGETLPKETLHTGPQLVVDPLILQGAVTLQQATEVMVALDEAEQSLASVTNTEYVPAERPLMVDAELLLFHK